MKYLFTILALVLLINISNAQTKLQNNKNRVSYYNPRNYDAKKTRNRIITISVGATAATIGTIVWLNERRKYEPNMGNYKNKPTWNNDVKNVGRALFITGTITLSVGLFIR